MRLFIVYVFLFVLFLRAYVARSYFSSFLFFLFFLRAPLRVNWIFYAGGRLLCVTSAVLVPPPTSRAAGGPPREIDTTTYMSE